MNDLTHLADLIRISNYVTSRISQIIDRPANIGSIGEHIAAEIFDIAPHTNFVTKASDGIFRREPLMGSSVNIKFYSRFGGLLDIIHSEAPADHPDYYLVMSGPIPKSATTKGTQAPLVIQTVHLFHAPTLLEALRSNPSKPLKPGTATSVRKHLWEAAMIYPEQVNRTLILSDEQRGALALFASTST